MKYCKQLKAACMLLIVILCCHAQGKAQSGGIKGIVMDADNEPVFGVSIECKPQAKNEKSISTFSNEKGEFSFTGLKDGSKYDLFFSHLNYTRHSIADLLIKEGDNNSLLVKLKAVDNSLNEVIVTSLGITKEKKRLGYAVQEVKGADLNTAKGGNMLSGLQGKVAGLNMTQVSGGLAGSNRIVLRGESSLNLNKNIAMVVVDGVPINNNLGTGASSDLSIDYGSGGAEINPDDIASISIMKGPNAAALYGSRAANGVIIIKTKRAAEGKRLGVSVTSNTSFDRVLQTPEFQNEYGGGTGVGLNYYSYGDGPDGPNTSNSGHNWGAKFNGQNFIQYGSPIGPDGKRIASPWRAHPDNVKDFYVTGITYMNGLSVQKSADVANFRASYNHYRQTGIMPNTELNRHQFNTNSTIKLSSKLSFNANVNYINSFSDNLPVMGYGGASPTYNFIWTERNASMDWFRNYWQKGQEGIKQDYYFTWGDNPYMTMYEQLNGMDRNRLFGNVHFNYSILPDLTLMVRTGLDYSGERRSSQRPKSSVVAINGLYRRQDLDYLERNSDFLLSYTAPKMGKFNLSASAGGNNLQINTSSNTVTANGLVIPGVYNLGNASGRPIVEEFNSQKIVNSLYGVADLDYDNTFFLQLTARNDWSSTLPRNNNSYFYSSASLSALMTEALNIKSDVLNYWKLRASYAQVGNDTDPYQTSAYYEYNTLPGTVGLPAAIPNTNLKPEITGSFEIGTELKLLNNRVSLDASWYSATSKNQILRSPLSQATYYGSKVMNAGEISNKGWEMVLGVTPVKKKLVWDIFFTASANRSKVVELADGVESYVMASAQGATIEARVGGRMGDIYGVGLLRNEAGKVIYKGGVPVFTSNTLRLGNYNPDWLGGIRNSLRYKDWSMSVLLDGKFGGKIYSFTHVTGTEAGSLANTLPGREGGIIGDGVVLNGDGSYSPNTERVAAYTYYRGYYKRPNVESSTFDASFVKLREVILGYRLPARFLKDKLVQSLDCSLTGRNLLLFTKVPGVDPETSFVSGGTVVPGIENAQIPSTRSLGIDIKITF
ncbi:SusC/RagA family TonB-linked outer membrane protein [Chitinophaga horti]|uniref:SusC/RagA family TonB-linked outer membrane protein n=1 Tax=Chitinophaga horti TaxID=2920382 RepID=A0ABY6J5W8_9BACT|nr:SusC/RagA family TonB-linked outer membrane protein [Chitinophaga horti]UYQ95008.1 SusC/RagA family TonB-linked outer membrane protein [Chitinophaga horti]